MDMTPLVSSRLKLVQSYGAGFFRINGEIFRHAVLLCGEGAVEEWLVPSFVELAPQIKNLSGKIDVLLIGAGESFSVLSPSQRAVFSNLGFTVDVMDTPAALRTYNILAAEGRLVAAALMPVQFL